MASIRQPKHCTYVLNPLVPTNGNDTNPQLRTKYLKKRHYGEVQSIFPDFFASIDKTLNTKCWAIIL